jgi:hypothetical protein
LSSSSAGTLTSKRWAGIRRGAASAAGIGNPFPQRGQRIVFPAASVSATFSAVEHDGHDTRFVNVIIHPQNGSTREHYARTNTGSPLYPAYMKKG